MSGTVFNIVVIHPININSLNSFKSTCHTVSWSNLVGALSNKGLSGNDYLLFLMAFGHVYGISKRTLCTDCTHIAPIA